MWENSKFSVTLQNGQEKVKVKTTSPVHNFIILANCWNHNRWSMSNGSMSCGVHKVTPVHGTMWENSKFFVILQKDQGLKQQVLFTTS